MSETSIKSSVLALSQLDKYRNGGSEKLNDFLESYGK